MDKSVNKRKVAVEETKCLADLPLSKQNMQNLKLHS
jgi:hypothetical protein